MVCFIPSSAATLKATPPHQEDLHRLISEKGIDQFVVKPLAGKTGVSVLVLELVEKTPGDYVFEDRGGERYDLDRLVKHMSRKVEFGQQGFIMEARIVNHPDIAKLNPSSVNTCRLVTFMNFEGEVSIILSVIRIGVKGKNTDNWHTGGLAAAIDRHRHSRRRTYHLIFPTAAGTPAIPTPAQQ